MKIQIDNQVGERVGIVVTCGPIRSVVSIVLRHDSAEGLGVTPFAGQIRAFQLACTGLQAVWLNMILAYEAHQRAARKQPEQVAVVCTPPKQKLLLAPLQEVVWSLPLGTHR